MAKSKKTIAELYQETEEYLIFLKKRLDSSNYKSNVSEEEFKKTKEKYDKAKLRLKLLK